MKKVCRRAETGHCRCNDYLLTQSPIQKDCQMSPNLVMFAAGYGMLLLSYALVASPYRMIHPF